MLLFLYPTIYNNEQKIELNNHNYYIGQVKNGKPNGKGKIYGKNDILIYEGDFMNGLYEGIGNIYLGNDKYYYGNFKNGKYNGKGVLYQRLKDKFIYIIDDNTESKEEKAFYLRNEENMKKV